MIEFSCCAMQKLSALPILSLARQVSQSNILSIYAVSSGILSHMCRERKRHGITSWKFIQSQLKQKFNEGKSQFGGFCYTHNNLADLYKIVQIVYDSTSVHNMHNIFDSSTLGFTELTKKAVGGPNCLLNVNRCGHLGRARPLGQNSSIYCHLVLEGGGEEESTDH